MPVFWIPVENNLSIQTQIQNWSFPHQGIRFKTEISKVLLYIIALTDLGDESSAAL